VCDDAVVDKFECDAWLDWWANASTCLASFEVAVRIDAADAGWRAQGWLRHKEDREGLEFFCDLDPVFMLRIGEDSTIAASVTLSPESAVFTLAEYAE
jgi:hypothetical protein